MIRSIRLAAVLSILALPACSEVLSLDVEAPGRIADDDLNTPEAVAALVVGMSFDLTGAVQAQLQEVLMAGGELWHGGSYDFAEIPSGKLVDTPEYWNGAYGSMQEARWVAEHGLVRIASVLEPADFESNEHVARAYLLGAFANRLLGEVQCFSTIDGGPQVPNTEHFVRADSMFTRAIAVGTASGADDIVTAAYGGRASVRAWLGDWTAAVTDAQQVPDDFEYFVLFNTTAGSIANDLVNETTNRKEFTVFTTIWDDVDGDPRVPWDTLFDDGGQVERGQDGETLFFQQLKLLTEDSDIRLTHGSEMLVLRAEERLRAGDIPGMVLLLDQARAVYGMDPIAPLDIPVTTADAWELLRFERGATLWLEGRRLWDLRRWASEGGVVADPFSEGRDLCFPISDEESRVNPNL